jgi:hypothetical protein
MLCCFLFLQGNNCWLYFEDKTVSEFQIQVECTLESTRCDGTKTQLF